MAGHGPQAPVQLGSQPALGQPLVTWGLGHIWLEHLVPAAGWNALLGMVVVWSRMFIL